MDILTSTLAYFNKKTKFCSLKGLVVFLFTRKDESATQRLKRKKIILYFGLSHLLSINAWTIFSFKNHSILVNIRCICTVGTLAIACVGAPFCCFLPVADIFSREWLGCSYRFLLFSSDHGAIICTFLSGQPPYSPPDKAPPPPH